MFPFLPSESLFSSHSFLFSFFHSFPPPFPLFLSSLMPSFSIVCPSLHLDISLFFLFIFTVSFFFLSLASLFTNFLPYSRYFFLPSCFSFPVSITFFFVTFYFSFSVPFLYLSLFFCFIAIIKLTFDWYQIPYNALAEYTTSTSDSLESFHIRLSRHF